MSLYEGSGGLVFGGSSQSSSDNKMLSPRFSSGGGGGGGGRPSLTWIALVTQDLSETLRLNKIETLLNFKISRKTYYFSIKQISLEGSNLEEYEKKFLTAPDQSVMTTPKNTTS